MFYSCTCNKKIIFLFRYFHITALDNLSHCCVVITHIDLERTLNPGNFWVFGHWMWLTWAWNAIRDGMYCWFLEGWNSSNLIYILNCDGSLSVRSVLQVPYAELTPLQAAVGVVQKVTSLSIELKHALVQHAPPACMHPSLILLVFFVISSNGWFQLLNLSNQLAFNMRFHSGFEAHHSWERQSETKWAAATLLAIRHDRKA